MHSSSKHAKRRNTCVKLVVMVVNVRRSRRKYHVVIVKYHTACSFSIKEEDVNAKILKTGIIHKMYHSSMCFGPKRYIAVLLFLGKLAADSILLENVVVVAIVVSVSVSVSVSVTVTI